MSKKRSFIEILTELKQSSFKALASLGKRLCHRKDGVARVWWFIKSNEITKGVHRKMNLIQRRAYGFRNFKNYRARVGVLCE